MNKDEVIQLKTFIDRILPIYKRLNSKEFYYLASCAENDKEAIEPSIKTIHGLLDNLENPVLKGVVYGIDLHKTGEADNSETKVEADENGNLELSITLAEHSDAISCYVRAQLRGEGGICMSQPFICDDGDMQRFRSKDIALKEYKGIELFKKKFVDTRLGVIANKLFIKKQYNNHYF